MNTSTRTARAVCRSCQGSGLYAGPTAYVDQARRPYCFGCQGTGFTAVRKPRVVQARVPSATVRIADRCAGDPTKIDLNNTCLLAYIGLSADDVERYQSLWNAGVREVAR